MNVDNLPMHRKQSLCFPCSASTHLQGAFEVFCDQRSEPGLDGQMLSCLCGPLGDTCVCAVPVMFMRVGVQVFQPPHSRSTVCDLFLHGRAPR